MFHVWFWMCSSFCVCSFDVGSVTWEPLLVLAYTRVQSNLWRYVERFPGFRALIVSECICELLVLSFWEFVLSACLEIQQDAQMSSPFVFFMCGTCAQPDSPAPLFCYAVMLAAADVAGLYRSLRIATGLCYFHVRNM